MIYISAFRLFMGIAILTSLSYLELDNAWVIWIADLGWNNWLSTYVSLF